MKSVYETKLFAKLIAGIAMAPRIAFDLFPDAGSLELPVGGGRHTMTGKVYPDPEKAQGVRFFAEGGVFADIEKYDII